jgi:hypothetical protein
MRAQDQVHEQHQSSTSYGCSRFTFKHQDKSEQLKTFPDHFAKSKQQSDKWHSQMRPNWNFATTGILMGPHFEQ